METPRVSVAVWAALTLISVLGLAACIQFLGRDFIIALAVEVVLSLSRDVALHWRRQVAARRGDKDGENDEEP